ncbi:MAG: polysaccharide pyruvyl transferase family protein [Lachnospiraceae bacterium]|nr:polysaccharide pyruvyl transferase family protein [Lachnospiraceae bacterium]
MRLIISTLHFYNNFGSVLQAYALKHVLEERFGCVAKISDYRPDLPEYRYFTSTELLKGYEVKKEKFADFREKYLELSDGTDCDYDVRAVGSDIVWGKEFSKLDSSYFLSDDRVNFKRDGKKIAYAASVILRDGCTEDDELFKRYLPELDSIAVRETTAVEVISRLSGKEVQAVLDPTLLLDSCDYDALIDQYKAQSSIMSEPYLLSYFLTHDPAVVDYSNMIARKLELKVVHYFADYPDRIFDADSKCFAFAGPEEFLALVKNAALVFTNSFHGTCFSMIYRKPFYTYTAKRAMLSRVKDLCARLGMEDRYFTDFRDLKKVTLDIDYSEFEKQLEVWRKKSFDFLEQALQKEAKDV